MVKSLFNEYKKILAAPIFALVLSLIFFSVDKLSFFYSSLIVVSSLIIPFFYIIFDKVRLKIRRLTYLENSKYTYQSVDRVLKSGDSHITERRRIENVGKRTFQTLERVSLKALAEDIKVFTPELISSSNKQQKIIYSYSTVYDTKLRVDDKTELYKSIDCSFYLEKPLQPNNDFVEFEVSTEIKKGSKDAFTQEGALSGTYIYSLCDKVSVTVIAPKKCKLEILDVFVQDSHGNRINKLSDSFKKKPPRLTSNDSVLEWSFTYPVINHYYLVRYRIL